MSAFTFDEIVLQLREQGVPLDAAEAAARNELGIGLGLRSRAQLLAECALETPDLDGVARLGKDALEDAHINEGKKLVRALGGFVYSSVQKRRAKVTPGQPDTLLFFPKHRAMVWWEAKAEWGRQSSAQKLFQEVCEACGGEYVCGPLRALECWIIGNRVGRKEPDGSWTPLEFHPDPAG